MMLKSLGFVIFVLYFNAVDSSIIPCRTIDDCRGVLQPSGDYQCINNICMCANTTTRNYEYCENRNIVSLVRATGLKRNCSTHEECEKFVQDAVCQPSNKFDPNSQGICTCPSLMVESTDGKRCIRYATHPGERCKETIQCTYRLENGACEEGFCRCPVGFHYENWSNKCLRSLRYGQYCRPNEGTCYQDEEVDGPNLLFCNTTLGHCMCIKHWHYNPNAGACEYSSASSIGISVSMLLVALLSLKLR